MILPDPPQQKAPATAYAVHMAMRRLVYAVSAHHNAPGLESPTDVHMVLDQLDLIADEVSETLNHLAAYLENELTETGASFHMLGPSSDPVKHVLAFGESVRDAERALGSLRSAVNDARSATRQVIPSPDGRRRSRWWRRLYPKQADTAGRKLS